MGAPILLPDSYKMRGLTITDSGLVVARGGLNVQNVAANHLNFTAGSAPVLSSVNAHIASNSVLSGNDQVGIIQFATDATGIATVSALFTVTLANAFGNQAWVPLLVDIQGAGVTFCCFNVSSSAFTVKNVSALAALTTFKLGYFIAGNG